MKNFTLLLTIIIFSSPALLCNIINVGPGENIKVPSAAAAIAKDNDSIIIASGIYSGDVCVWAANNLLIRGLGIESMVHLKADGKSAQGKAIWVIRGNNCTVENIEFSGCTVPDKNGAGIRAEGNNLTVRHCYFHDNEDGILGGGNSESEVVIEFSEFSHNGYGDGYSHNMYIGNIKKFTLQFSYSHHAKSGHNVKSRAKSNYIQYNRIMDETDGNASYQVDLPNGGYSFVMGNSIMKGTKAENNAFISYGREALLPGYFNTLVVLNNTFVNERKNAIVVTVADSIQKALLMNNIYVNASFFNGKCDTMRNLKLSRVEDAHFKNPAVFDYHLVEGSPAIHKAINPLLISSIPLPLPDYEYKEKCDSTARFLYENELISIGAFEYHIPNAVNELNYIPENELNIYPNPTQNNININLAGKMTEAAETTPVNIYDMLGQKVMESSIPAGARELKIDLKGLPPGVYLLKVRDRMSKIVKM